MRRNRGWIARLPVLLAVLTVSVAVAGLAAAPAGAQAQRSATRAVPSCGGFGHLPKGPHMWQDEHGAEKSELARGIAEMICSAAHDSTIDIKSWFVTPTGPATRRIIHALQLMHKYHGVHVNVFIDRTWYPADKWTAFRRAFPFARVFSCRHSCKSNLPGSISHSKWITVSRLRVRNGGGSAVLSTSLNPSGEQFRSRQSGILIIRDRALYFTFKHEWKTYVRCATGSACKHTIPSGKWVGRSRTKVWFEPTKLDPTHEAMSHLSCRHGGKIDAMSLYLFRRTILDDLLRLRSEGCTVRVLLEHWDSKRAAPWNHLHPRCGFSHGKMLLIRVGSTREIIAGSQDLTPGEIFRDDNQMIRTTSTSVVGQYADYFHNAWYSKSTTACSNGGFFGGTPMDLDG